MYQRPSLALVFIGALLFACAGASAQDPYPTQRMKIDMVAITGGCSIDNPLFELTQVSPNYPATNVVVCENTSGSQASESFSSPVVNPGAQPVWLGCLGDSGITNQNFTIHWEESAPEAPPADVTVAANDIRVYKENCNASLGCIYYISNRHYFKSIQVTYYYQGQTHNVTISPLSDILVAPVNASPPHIEGAQFLSNYELGLCVSGTDQYPPIRYIPSSNQQ
jgi:hypothetical protein